MHYILIFFSVLAFVGCGDSTVIAEGFHFQGRDCLKCHNVDLAESSHLEFAGSVFVDATSNNEDLSQSCNQDLYVEMLAASGAKFDSRETTKPTDSGFKAKGNIFTLLKDGKIENDLYRIRIINQNGEEIAASSLVPSHSFNGQYDPENSADSSNRYSCNACHGVTSPRLYANTSSTLCRK